MLDELNLEALWARNHPDPGYDLTEIEDMIAGWGPNPIFTRKKKPEAPVTEADTSEFISQGKHVDVTAELAGIHYGAIHETWKRCMASLLAHSETVGAAIETIFAATEASPGCQADPGKARWMHGLCEMAVRFLQQNPLHVTQLSPEAQEAWHRNTAEGKRPRLVHDKRRGLHLRGYLPKSGPEPSPAPEQATKAPPGDEPQQPKKYRFPLLRFGEMRPGTEPNYLVDELIPVAGLVLVYGAPKGGKSFWVLDLVLHIALGWEYRERAVQQGTIIYCAFEGAHGYRKRCEAFRRHHCLTDEDPPLYVVPGRADLIKDHAALIREMRDQIVHDQESGLAGSVRCVVLDTLNKSLIGSESKDVDMANYIAAAEAIQAAFSCVVIIVHHHGIDDSRPRGHTSLRGAVDTQIKVVRDGQNVIVAEIEDMRDGPEGAQIMSRLAVVDVGTDNADDP
jgi:AAA domain